MNPAAENPAATAPADGPEPGAAEPYDLLGIGIGPFNLSLAALAADLPDLTSVFLEAKEDFSWHPGLLLDGARLQVPFLADLVSLVDPTSRWSFPNYLREHDRLFPFYFSERSHPLRREYDHYCRWAARSLPNCRFGAEATAVRWDPRHHHFTVHHRAPDGSTGRTRARNLVLGTGTRPAVPEAFAGVLGESAWHAADHLHRKTTLADATDITVVGSGQSGAEVFLDLLRDRTAATGTAGPLRTGSRAAGGDGPPAAPAATLRWLTRTRAFAPMEYSKLGLEQFTPDYTRYFHGLPAAARERLLPEQWQLYKAASAETLGEIHDLLYEHTVGGADARVELLPDHAVTAARRTPDGRLELETRHNATGGAGAVRTQYLVLATGFTARRPEFLDPVADLVDFDDRGRFRVDRHYRVAMDPAVTGAVFVQNAELHTHGVGTPDLGLGAWRAAVVLNAAAGRTVHRLPERTAFTSFTAHLPTDPPTDPRTDPPSDVPADRRAPAAPHRKESDRAAAPAG